MQGRSVVDHWTHNPEVVGSIPSPASNLCTRSSNGRATFLYIVGCGFDSCRVLQFRKVKQWGRPATGFETQVSFNRVGFDSSSFRQSPLQSRTPQIMKDRSIKDQKTQPVNINPAPGDSMVPGHAYTALKQCYARVIASLKIKPERKSLAQLTDEAEHISKAAFTLCDSTASTMAYVDGAIDALNYGKPEDIKRAKSMLERARRDLVLSMESANHLPKADKMSPTETEPPKASDESPSPS